MTTTRKIRYAVVGAGNIAQVAILPAFANASENSELVAIVSSDAQKRDALRERYRLQTVGPYDQLEQILEQARVDAVYIALPNSMHREYTERAAKQGVHVLCEKPLADTVEDCEAMIEACAKNDVRLMTAYRLHFEEANLQAIELVKSEEIGLPRLFTSVFTQQVRPDDIRTRGTLAGGALFDMGIYCINAARNLFRDEPEEVLGSCLRGIDARFDQVDESTSAILRFPGGRLAQITASLGSASVSTYRIVGTKGDLRVEPAYDYTTDLTHHLTVGERTRTHAYKRRDQFAPEIITFSRAILSGKEPEPSGHEGLADVRVMRAILQSAEQGKAVHLTPFVRRHRPDLSQNIHKPAIEAPAPVNAPAPTR
jgi:predicted dehydrogenase